MSSEKVECLSGHTYADRPIAIYWEEQRIQIEKIEARWRFPGGRRFLIKTKDERLFELIYHEHEDEWIIHPG
jgi:hypothetical protein